MLYFFETVIDFPPESAEARKAWWQARKGEHSRYADYVTTPSGKRVDAVVVILIEDRKVVIRTWPNLGVERVAFDRALRSMQAYLERFRETRPIGFTYATSERVGMGIDAGITSGGGWVFVADEALWEETTQESLERFQEKHAKTGGSRG